MSWDSLSRDEYQVARSASECYTNAAIVPSLTTRPIIIMCVNVARFRELALSVSDSKQHFKSFWYVHCRPFSLYILSLYVWNLSRPATATTTEWRKIKIEIIEWEIYWFILDQHSHSLSMQSAVGNRTNINFSSWVDVCARCYWLRVEWRRPSWAHRRGKNRKGKKRTRTMGLIYFQGEIRKQNDNSYEIIGMVNRKWKISMKIKTMKHFEELNQFFTAFVFLSVPVCVCFSESFSTFFVSFIPRQLREKFCVLAHGKLWSFFLFTLVIFTIFRVSLAIMSKIMSGILS